MDVNRFKMSFNSGRNSEGRMAPAPLTPAPLAPAPKSFSLKVPMIDRIHQAKPGCSACGKKVH